MDLRAELSTNQFFLAAPPPVEESAGEEDDEDVEVEEKVPTIVLKSSDIHELDSLTSDMAAKLQSMISEEETTVPTDDPILSPPPPPVAWSRTEDSDAAVTVSGSVDEDEEDESSGNSQSPRQVHKHTPIEEQAKEEREETNSIQWLVVIYCNRRENPSSCIIPANLSQNQTNCPFSPLKM